MLTTGGRLCGHIINASSIYLGFHLAERTRLTPRRKKRDFQE